MNLDRPSFRLGLWAGLTAAALLLLVLLFSGDLSASQFIYVDF
jgi:hypothetical protein